jgi:hypothetical protein
MANPSDSTVQNLLPVQAYFDVQGNFQTFIGQGKPFYATISPNQSGLNITNSTINSTTIGVTSPAVAYFTSAYVSVAPTTATGVANKQYVDYYAAGLSWKQPVKAASLSNIASLSGFQTIDTVPLTDGDRILVKDQSLSKDNGIYVVRSGAWEYAVGADDWQEYVGAIVFVEEGSQAYSAWYSLAQEGGTLGVTSLNWANFSVSSTYSAGTGLTLNAGVFSITNTGVINATYGSASKTVTLAINAQGQATSASQQDIAIVATQITSGTIDSARLSGSYSGITGLGTLTNLTVTNPISGSVTGSSAITTNLLGGATGSLPYQTATNTTGFLVASTDGYILSLVSGVPAWIPNTVGTVTAVTASAPLASSGGSAPNITITQAGTASNGYLSSTDWNTFNNKANSGANSDITSMTGITGGISTVDYIGFDTGYATTLTAGQLGWDGNNTLGLGMSGGNIVQQIGLQTFIYGKASSAITKGQLIKKTGANGSSGVITFAPTTANMTDSGAIIGIAAENISLNGFGYILSTGNLRGFDTTGSSSGETWADGDTLYYSPSGNGLMTKTKPSAPNIKTEVAIVTNASSGGSGSVVVEIIHGSVLGGTDSNVQITSPTGGQILSYDQTNGFWSNINLTAGTGISITPTTGGAITIANTVTGGITITDDTTTNATRYLTFTSATSGTITGENVSSTKLQFNPSTGALTATSLTPTNALTVDYGGTGATTLTGVLKGNGTSAFTAATAGTDFVAPGTATTFTALQTFAGTSSNADLKTSNIIETATISATAATGTINYDITTQSVLYYTSNASGNFTVNFRGSSGTSLNTLMATGESISVTFLVTNGSTAYYNSAVQVDGNSVTPKWQGGTAPTSGNASSIDSYTYVIFKTGSAAFTILASQTKFA